MIELRDVSVDDKVLLYALALFGTPLKQVNLSALIQQRGDKLENGHDYDNSAVKNALTRLTAAELVKFDVGVGYAIDPYFHMEILAELQGNQQIGAWVLSVRELLKRYGEYNQWKAHNTVFCRREMLFAALLGDFDDYYVWQSKFNEVRKPGQISLAEMFFGERGGEAVLAALSSQLQAWILIDYLSYSSWYLEDCRAAYAFTKSRINELVPTLPKLLEVFSWQAFLRAEFDTISALRIQFKDDLGEPHVPVVLAELIARGDFLGAADLTDKYYKIIKAATGKRKLFFGNLMGLFYTLGQLARNTPASLKKAKDQVDEGVKSHHAHTYFLLQPFVNHLVKGVPLLAPVATTHSGLDAEFLFVVLAMFWQDLPSTNAYRARLFEYRQQSAKLGYQWLAAEFDALLQRQYNVESIFPNWHQERHLKPLYQALQKEETWQRALSALSQLKGENILASASLNDQRIIWLLTDLSHYILLEPREQKLGAKGTWSKGRVIALKRLAHEQDSLPAMTEQDKRLATCIRKTYDGYYGGSEYEMNGEKALPHLIGHPAVYWADAPDVRIDIVKGEVALLLKEQGNLISMQLEPSIGNGTSVVWRKETPTRLAIFSASAEIKQIAGILGSGLSVPMNAKAQLVDVIAAIAPHLAIHSDLPELAAHITNVVANTTLYAHLLPLQEGLRLQMLVRPLPEGGWYTPGKGAANVLGEQDGKVVQANRDLAAEAKDLQAVIDACPAFQEAEESASSMHQKTSATAHGAHAAHLQEWELQQPEQCLELLSQLKALPAERLQLVWPEGERFRLKANSSLTQMRLTIKKQGEWFVAGGEITLDDGRILALRELMHLAGNTSGRFLKLGENDYLALTDTFRRRLDELRSFGELTGQDGVRINPLAAPILAELAADVGDLKADSEWREQMTKLDSLSEFMPTVPSTLQVELRDYQIEGYQWLARLAHWGVGACLADDMGLGKTVQTLALLLDRAPHGPALVVAPISVAMNWQAEVARFAPTLKVRSYHTERSLENLGAFDLVIASYGMLQSDAEHFSAQHWHSVVLDEAQVIKNAATKRSQAAMALTADFKMIASGTPVENHLGELWNLFRFINPGLLGSRERFVERFSNPIERGNQAGKQARQHLKKLIQPFILRRTKTQVLSELPSRTEITLQVTLSDEERHLYEALRQEAIEKIGHVNPADGKTMQVLAEITKLRRFCCHPQLVMKNATISGSKLAVFAETVEELLDNRHKALVFSQFVDHLALVRTWLEEKGISYQYLDGSTPALERKKRVDAFQAGQGDVFLISLKAGGTGLNLTAADYVIHLDPWWNPAVEDQASDRAHRMGQLRPVTIYRLVTQDTIEEKILALHAEKRDLADSLLEGGEVAGKMDTAALLRLLKEAV
jgi:superfamily II DNA or RNA helicase